MFVLVVFYYPIKGIGYIIEPIGFWFIIGTAPSKLLILSYMPCIGGVIPLGGYRII
jgi:hypothetical protein